MTCIVNVNGDYSDLSARNDLKLCMCNLDIPEDAHQGRGHYNESNYPVQELGRKGGGGGGGGGGISGTLYGSSMSMWFEPACCHM